MVDITAQMVKELREATGAGVLDCKQALQENNGDFEKAIEYLREKGMAAAPEGDPFEEARSEEQGSNGLGGFSNGKEAW